MKLSPMMQQYMDIKEQYRDCILFFRLGDFYEMFFEDAKLASKELELTLTGKACGQEERAPMCGVPFHAADGYIARLVEKGYKVAICEQTEDPAQAKGIVKREVIQVVTPGTLTSQSMLHENENNYLAAVYAEEQAMAVAYCDISTGELYLTEYQGLDIYPTLLNELVKIKAKEIILNEDFPLRYSVEEVKQTTEAYLNILSESYYSEKACVEAIKAQFGTVSLTGLGLDFRSRAVRALGALLNYLFETQKQNLKHLTHIRHYEIGTRMALDKATVRNLEITETLYEKKVQGSLLGVLDKTRTAMGSRKMRQWLREPLNDAAEINERLNGVEELYHDLLTRSNIRENLRHVYDFERLIGRIACGNANGRDMIALRNSIAVLPELKSDLGLMQSAALRKLCDMIDCLTDVYDVIDRAICEDPPFTIKEGGLIKEGFSEELDHLNFSIQDGKEWISNLESTERERTGIKNLKVGYNRVFGYYLEVTKSYFDLIPENYIRKQTLANAERFITPELKEMENLVLNAQTKINQLEYELFVGVREEIQRYMETIQQTSAAVAELDVLSAFAQVSEKLGYVKPVVDTSMELEIIKGRHPVIEQMVSDGLFVSNDTYLNDRDASLLLITGPNMAGKSTYMRQTALIVLMAQIGSFVPAEKANIGIVDRIFTRVGASDDLASGQSTFMVEMTEVANILRNATSRSLLILDEIGRGTSTFDGLAIAWAVIEHISNTKLCGAKTLFATHYHELTELEGKIPGVNNYCIAVKEKGDDIVFLRKIVQGGADKSYGIQVAKLAGVPDSVIQRAKELVEELSDADITAAVKDLTSAKKKKPVYDQMDMAQMSLFDTVKDDDIIEEIKGLDMGNMTPIEAMNTLYNLQNKIKNRW